MRYRLFAGFAVSVANVSNPTVAFTRSRHTSHAASASPFRKRVAASSRSARERRVALHALRDGPLEVTRERHFVTFTQDL
jgi:hypothetical protein